MGAVLGIAAFGRTQEKLNGANNGGLQAPATGFPSVPSAPSIPSTGFSAPSSGFGGGGFGSVPATTAPSTSFAPAQSWGTTQIATTASGKKLVPDEPQPAI
jgi:hypothetical protein